MSDPDSSSHRLRLVYLSAAIILYFVAGGHFEGNTVNFPLINIQFDHERAIYFFVWVLLGWYYWRFWVSIDSALFTHLESYFAQYADEHLTNQLKRQIPEKNSDSAHFVHAGVERNRFRVIDSDWYRNARYSTQPDNKNDHPVSLKIPILSITTLGFLFWVRRFRVFDQLVFPLLSAWAAVAVAGSFFAYEWIPRLFALK